MSIQFDADGQMVLEELDDKEISTIVEQIKDWVVNSYAEWEEEYGPIEVISVDDLGVEEVADRLSRSDENHIWADLNYNTGSEINPVPGLTLSVNGWAYLPGKDNFRDEGESYAYSAKPWSGSPYSIEPVYKLIQTVCVFCDGSGERNDDECLACEGEGELCIDY